MISNREERIPQSKHHRMYRRARKNENARSRPRWSLLRLLWHHIGRTIVRRRLMCRCSRMFATTINTETTFLSVFRDGVIISDLE